MKKIIFVTGSHRSGSTWIGKIISSANRVRYVHEPFNMRQKRNNSPFKYWFEYVSKKSDKDYQERVRVYLKSFYSTSLNSFSSSLLNSRNTREVYHFFKGIKGRLSDRTLIKDPIAIMSMDWLEANLNCDVIITVRHPAAFIASLKVKSWEFDFNNFLDQPELMDSLLNEFSDDISSFSKNKPDMIMQGILLWNTIYSTVLKYKEAHDKDWCFVLHEDLSREPLREFQKIFNYLNLYFDDRVQKEIIASTASSESTKLKRDSKANISSWKKRLSAQEISLIKKETQSIWSKFYSDSDW